MRSVLGGRENVSVNAVDVTYCAYRSVCSLTEKALVCQKAEHTFAGTPCGIMDQLVSVMAQQQHVVLIDCR